MGGKIKERNEKESEGGKKSRLKEKMDTITYNAYK